MYSPICEPCLYCLMKEVLSLWWEHNGSLIGKGHTLRVNAASLEIWSTQVGVIGRDWVKGVWLLCSSLCFRFKLYFRKLLSHGLRYTLQAEPSPTGLGFALDQGPGWDPQGTPGWVCERFEKKKSSLYNWVGTIFIVKSTVQIHVLMNIITF